MRRSFYYGSLNQILDLSSLHGTDISSIFRELSTSCASVICQSCKLYFLKVIKLWYDSLREYCTPLSSGYEVLHVYMANIVPRCFHIRSYKIEHLLYIYFRLFKGSNIGAAEGNFSVNCVANILSRGKYWAEDTIT